MKASDLMVGDWVLDTYTNKPMKIESINGGNPRFGQDLEPIPLTPEILEKNGFKDMGFFGKLEIGPWRLICDSSNLAVLHEGREEEYINIPISYVHELQHALRLCGIDLDIKL